MTKNLRNGTQVTVNMNGTTTIPQSALADVKDRNVDLVLDFGTYPWTINGKNIAQANSLDLGVTYSPNVVSSDIVAGTGMEFDFQVQLNHEGALGFTGVLTVHLPADKAGQYTNIYYYNPPLNTRLISGIYINFY